MVIHYHRFIIYLLLLVLGSTITKIQRLSRLVSLITIIVQIELVAHVERGKYIGR